MVSPDDQMREAIEELWIAVFGQPPSIRCDPRLLTEILVGSLSSPPPYGDPPPMRDGEPLPPHRPHDVTKPRRDPN